MTFVRMTNPNARTSVLMRAPSISGFWKIFWKFFSPTNFHLPMPVQSVKA